MTIIMMPSSSSHGSFHPGPGSSPLNKGGNATSRSPAPDVIDIPPSFAPPNTSHRSSEPLSPHESLIAPSSSVDSHRTELAMYASHPKMDKRSTMGHHYHVSHHTTSGRHGRHTSSITSTAVSPSPKTSAERTLAPSSQKIGSGCSKNPTGTPSNGSNLKINSGIVRSKRCDNENEPAIASNSDILVLNPSDSNDLPSLCSVPSIGSGITSASSTGGTPTSTGRVTSKKFDLSTSSAALISDRSKSKKRKAFGITCDTSDETLLASLENERENDCANPPSHVRPRLNSPSTTEQYSPNNCGFSFGMNSPWNKSSQKDRDGGSNGICNNAFREVCAASNDFSPSHNGGASSTGVEKIGGTPPITFVSDIGGNQVVGNSSFDAVTSFSWMHSPTDAFMNGPDGTSSPFFYEDEKKVQETLHNHDDLSPRSLSPIDINRQRSSRRTKGSNGKVNPSSSSRQQSQFPISPMGGGSMKGPASPMRRVDGGDSRDHDQKITFSSSHDIDGNEDDTFDMHLAAERDLMEDDDMSVLMKLATGSGGGGDRDIGRNRSNRGVNGTHKQGSSISSCSYRPPPQRVGSSSANSIDDASSRSNSRMDFLRVGDGGRKQGGNGGNMPKIANNSSGVHTSVRGRNSGGVGLYKFGSTRSANGVRGGDSPSRTAKQRTSKPKMTINTKGINGLGAKDSPITVLKNKKSGLVPTPISINKMGQSKPKSFHEPNMVNHNNRRPTSQRNQMSRGLVEPIPTQSRPVHPQPPPPQPSQAHPQPHPQVHPQSHPQAHPQPPHPQHTHPGHHGHHPHSHHHEPMHPGTQMVSGYPGPPRHDQRMAQPDFSLMNKGYMPPGPQLQQYQSPQMPAYHMSPSDPRYHQQYYPAMHTSMGPKGMISMPHMQMGPGKHPHRQGGPPLQKSMMPRSNDGKSPKKKGSVRPPGGIVNSLNNPNSIAHGNAALSAAILRGVTMRPSGKWQAQLYYAGKSRYIGVFDTREKAAMAYEIAREKLKSEPNGAESKNTASNVSSTEAAVSLARKAAFEGVNEPDPRPIKR